MDTTTWLSSLGEMKVAAKYSQHHWDVFTQASGKSPFDLVVYKDSTLRRVQVKSTMTYTKYGSLSVQLRSIRSNKTVNKVKALDPKSYDELAVYLEPIDTILFYSPEEINGRSTLTLSAKAISNLRTEPRK